MYVVIMGAGTVGAPRRSVRRVAPKRAATPPPAGRGACRPRNVHAERGFGCAHVAMPAPFQALRVVEVSEDARVAAFLAFQIGHERVEGVPALREHFGGRVGGLDEVGLQAFVLLGVKQEAGGGLSVLFDDKMSKCSYTDRSLSSAHFIIAAAVS